MEERLEQLTYVQSLLIGVGIAAFYYFFIYAETSYDAMVQDFETQITQANTEITNVDKLIREKQELEAELLKNKELVKNSNDIVPLKFNADTALGDLTSKARSYGLSIESIGNFTDWSSEVQFEKAELSIGLKGTFGQMMFFISDFTRENGFYTFERLTLTPTNDSQPQQSAKSSQYLKIDLSVVVLKQIDRGVASPGAQ